MQNQFSRAKFCFPVSLPTETLCNAVSISTIFVFYVIRRDISRDYIHVENATCITRPIYESNSMLFEKEGGGVENFPLLHRGRKFLLSVV